jgi:biopolymer transport protein ExbD
MNRPPAAASGYNVPMARTFRRSTHESRMELTPLLDVIFILLTFFLYSQVLAVRAELLPVQLPELSSGERPADEKPLVAITVDANGRIYLNREVIAEDAIAEQVERILDRDRDASVYLALEAGEGSIDRGPIMYRILERLRKAGVRDLAFVGAPGKSVDE